jgi:hypothetical protein
MRKHTQSKSKNSITAVIPVAIALFMSLGHAPISDARKTSGPDTAAPVPAISDARKTSGPDKAAPVPAPSQSPGGTCCICEYLDGCGAETLAFKAACALWNPPECTSKVTVPYSSDPEKFKELVKNSCNGARQILTHFVGHWGSSDTPPDIKAKVKVCIDSSCSVYVNNTACSSLEDAEDVQRILDQYQLPPGVRFVYRGNQCTSIGDWEPLCRTANTQCTVTYGCTTGPEYPKCSDYKGKTCIDWVQGGEKIKCTDETGAIKELECCTNKLIDTWEPLGGCNYESCDSLDGDLCVDWLDPSSKQCAGPNGETQTVVCCEEGFWDHWRKPENCKKIANRSSTPNTDRSIQALIGNANSSRACRTTLKSP